MNPREILGVSANASKSEIKQAFREAAKEQHPDLSSSPEAAEAFAKIKEAHDALMKESGGPRDSGALTSSVARATAQATYRPADQDTTTKDDTVEHIQELDDLVRKSTRSFFKRNKESEEVKKHRKKLKTNERRLRGLY